MPLSTPWPDDPREQTARPRKGRGAVRNDSGRYEPYQRVACDDGWAGDDGDANTPPPLRTEVAEQQCRKLLSWNESPDVGFDRSVNPYRGCEHGCVYCFARPGHAYLGLSPGLDFESRLFAKVNAAEALEKELRRPGYVCAPVALGASTDPYQPIEKRYRLTRQVLKTLAACNHPVAVVTKSDLVLRDLDVLSGMADQGLASVAVSVTTLDGDLARRLEPRAPRPDRRLSAIKSLTDAGVPVTVMTAPMIPGLNDHELEAILERARDAGARRAGYVFLRLPLEIEGLFADWLQEHEPDRAKRVLSLVRQGRGGKLYNSRFGERMRGQGPYADLLAQRFKKACIRFGLNRESKPLRRDLFRPPPPKKAPAAANQLALFD